MNDIDNFLNSVDITSKIRAPGEYKYYYCGENNSETDKSFLVVSSMWFNDKITPDMEILASCYNPTNTAQLFYNNKTNYYNIMIYKNIIDYRNENMKLKLIHQINIPVNFKIDTTNNEIKIDLKKLKIFLVGTKYLLINIIDLNILLLDYINGKYITIFSRIFEEKETLFNVIDTYDEPYLQKGEQKIRTYVFLSKKSQERKTFSYAYKYFIIQKEELELKNILLHSLDFNLGTAEPLGLKIGKIFKPNSNGLKYSFIFIFISSSLLFELITDYDNENLHNMLKRNSKIENSKFESDEEDRINKDKSSKNLNKLNSGNNNFYYGSTKYWIVKTKIEAEKKNFTQCIKFLLNINDKRVCSLVLFFESRNMVAYNFNYTDSPEEIKNKIAIKSNINLSSEQRNFEQLFKAPAKIYKFTDLYLFKTKSFLNFSRNNLILCDTNKLHIYSENNNLPIYTYDFFEEDLSTSISIEGLGSTFLLSGNKLFKIIYNQRYDNFSDEKILKNSLKYFKTNKKLAFPIFEFDPQNIWNAYFTALGLDKIDFIEEINHNNNQEENGGSIRHSGSKNLGEKFCSLCLKKCSKFCSDCKARFYCCEEHFNYDFYTFHFFECQWIQFFKRKDIMNIKDTEIRYKILYNELIKVCGRILTFIFIRIYSKRDYQYFLNMILTMEKILENFGFRLNLSEFCNCNYSLNERIPNRYEKIIFYQEALFFYVNLTFLKCTFALKSNLYNLTDCYLKILNYDIVPLLTPKLNRRLLSLKCDKPSIDILYNNNYFNQFNSELFFDIEKFIKNNSAINNIIDLVEEYITKHLMCLSLLVKFKKKINSLMEVQNTFVDINLMFEDHFIENETKISSYCCFFTSFYLVEIGKVPQTVKLLRRMLSFFGKMDDGINILKYLTYYNLGVLQYALGDFDIGIHNIETAYKLIVENNFSDRIKFKVIDTLALAYLNKRNLYKAFLLIKKSMQERKKLNKKQDKIACTKLDVYLNYINDLYEYTFISKARLLIKKKYDDTDKKRLMKFVLGEEDKEMVISEQNIDQCIKVAKFIWDLPEEVLKQLNVDNPPKSSSNNKEEQHHDRNVSFNSEISMNNNTTFIYKENGVEKEDIDEEYEDDIEIKIGLYDSLLTRKQQQDFKDLKTVYLKRDIILRDSLGDIEKFNINYEPIFAVEFEKIIEKLKSNFLLKEIFYSFQSEKWRDELYNFNQNDILFGLSKYLKMEKIKNMLAIERTKIMELIRQKKLKLKKLKEDRDNKEINVNDNLLIDDKNHILIKDNDVFMEESRDRDLEISNEISSKSSSTILKEKEEGGKEDMTNIRYQQFKSKFIEALAELEKEKRNHDLYEFLDFDEDYLYYLYINVFKNNPDRAFILQNPLLILNYIFIEINKKPAIKINESDKEPEPNKPKEEEKKIENENEEEIKGIAEEKKENEEEMEKNNINSSLYNIDNEINQMKNKIENKKNEELNKEIKENSNENEKEENEENKNENEDSEKEDNNSKQDTKLNSLKKNILMEKFIQDENIYDYIRDDIDDTHEITLTFISIKQEKTPQKENINERQKHTNKKGSVKVKMKYNLLPSFVPERKQIDHRTFIKEANKLLLFSKENSKVNEDDKTFEEIRKNNRKSTQTEIQKLNMNLKESKKEEEKNENDNNNNLKGKYINYFPFINKKKKTSTKKLSSKNKIMDNKDENSENEPYFNLKKEIELNENKKRKKRREHNLSANIYDKGTSKSKDKNKKIRNIDEENNYYEQHNFESFEKILNAKSTNKKKNIQENKSRSKSKNKNRGKNTSFRYKSQEERDKEIEAGALLYLKNDYKLKKKNIMDDNNIKANERINRNKNSVLIKNRIFKSTDEKKVNKINKSNIEQDNYKIINKPKNKHRNRNKKLDLQKEIKFNSSTTLNSTSIEYNSIKEPAHKKAKNNINDKNLKKIVKKDEPDLFSKEYKKIIEYNKRKKNQSQDKNIPTSDNNYLNEMKNLYADIQNRTSRYENNATSPPANREDIKYNNSKTGDRKLYMIGNYYKKNNFIPTTNYTNTETPGNTRLVTFQGRGNNYNTKPRSKGKYKLI